VATYSDSPYATDAQMLDTSSDMEGGARTLIQHHSV
jgi:hypothetical protein